MSFLFFNFFKSPNPFIARVSGKSGKIFAKKSKKGLTGAKKVDILVNARLREQLETRDSKPANRTKKKE
ncbi:MAG: hypothetical protein J7647_30845 [Cyanobacteria bacterium SBLK]|nr:hypothetical protein [Cyanobacteria bacterium SBLK]